MGIENIVSRMYKQTAVYWGSPVNDGFGGKTFAEPIEIQCRWENKKELLKDVQGNEIVATSIVYVLQDMDEQGYLYLGLLDDFDSPIDINNPKKIDNAYEIKRFDKLPSIKGNEFIRKVYLK